MVVAPLYDCGVIFSDPGFAGDVPSAEPPREPPINNHMALLYARKTGFSILPWGRRSFCSSDWSIVELQSEFAGAAMSHCRD